MLRAITLVCRHRTCRLSIGSLKARCFELDREGVDASGLIFRGFREATVYHD